MKLKRCSKCHEVLYRRKYAGKLQLMHLINPGSRMEAFGQCQAELPDKLEAPHGLKQMFRI